MSLICAVVALVQFVEINLVLQSKHIFNIPDKPQYRIHSFFMNANYYATILEFIILMAFYKLAIVKDKESSFAFYSLVIIINIFLLYLTGCRTAWFALFASVPIIFLFQKKYYIATTLIITSLLIFFGTILFEIFPRIDTLLVDFNVRLKIWIAALHGFIQHPLLGVGPFGYKSIYLVNHGPKTIHAHSLYFDTLLSYGILGTATVLYSLSKYFKSLALTAHLKYYSLMIGILSVTLIHGILDITIMNLQVGLLALFIVSSVNYQNQV
ncbi:MAG: O-antigen ligase family protein [Mycoplasmatales bacterium]